MTLNEIQQTELEMLVVFDQIARQYSLKYSLWGGTLIGAIRHQGFIPWDDDIDLVMPRPDYERLIQLNKEEALLPSFLHLVSFEEETLDSPYAKILDTRTKLHIERYSQKGDSSLWIDIFPLDGLPEDKKTCERIYRKAFFLSKAYILSVENRGYGSNKVIMFVKDIFVKPLLKLISGRRISRRLRSLALKFPYNTSPKCGMITLPVDGLGQVLTIEEFEQPCEVPFEGHSFYATSFYEKYLTGVFGDYMQLPPENERISHNLEAFRL